eukprot:CAMPEP_0194282826 /NCGR_PEP_ID=MMETSP0169-20130528/23958_1 /TAXON_ID=218684 /ORGANISM="Corethron pennatum, Strain L29A3" /LENGTH=769 /DNA_ID=CAMNT_0039028259 /DNA_START=171 /DNA_END=2480 /DNA_ORIENTATION=-
MNVILVDAQAVRSQEIKSISEKAGFFTSRRSRKKLKGRPDSPFIHRSTETELKGRPDSPFVHNSTETDYVSDESSLASFTTTLKNSVNFFQKRKGRIIDRNDEEGNECNNEEEDDRADEEENECNNEEEEGRADEGGSECNNEGEEDRNSQEIASVHYQGSEMEKHRSFQKGAEFASLLKKMADEAKKKQEDLHEKGAEKSTEANEVVLEIDERDNKRREEQLWSDKMEEGRTPPSPRCGSAKLNQESESVHGSFDSVKSSATMKSSSSVMSVLKKLRKKKKTPGSNANAFWGVKKEKCVEQDKQVPDIPVDKESEEMIEKEEKPEESKNKLKENEEDEARTLHDEQTNYQVITSEEGHDGDAGGTNCDTREEGIDREAIRKAVGDVMRDAMCEARHTIDLETEAEYKNKTIVEHISEHISERISGCCVSHFLLGDLGDTEEKRKMEERARQLAQKIVIDVSRKVMPDEMERTAKEMQERRMRDKERRLLEDEEIVRTAKEVQKMAIRDAVARAVSEWEEKMRENEAAAEEAKIYEAVSLSTRVLHEYPYGTGHSSHPPPVKKYSLEVRVDAARESLSIINELFEEGSGEEGAKYTDLFLKAALLTIEEVPLSNAKWAGDHIRLMKRVDVNTTICDEDMGLAPVVKDAGAKGLRELVCSLRSLERREAADRLDEESLRPGTFSMYCTGEKLGLKSFAPALPNGQACTLGIGLIHELVVPDDKDPNFPYKKIMCVTVTLVCDDRILDAEEGVRWLNIFKKNIEVPTSLML